MEASRDVNAGQHRGGRRSIRLRGHDYAQAGAYFVTICALGRACLFGEVVDGAVRLNACGTIVEELWGAIPMHFPGTSIDEYVAMPNHLHGVLVLAEAPFTAPSGATPTAPEGAMHRAPAAALGTMDGVPAVPEGAMNRAPTLGEIVRAFKARVTRAVGAPVWQRNYYEHILRDEASLNRTRQYIRDNPAQWEHDDENPAFVGARFIAPSPRRAG